MANQVILQALLSKKISINDEFEKNIKTLEMEVNKKDKRGIDVMEDIRHFQAKQGATTNDLLLVEVNVQEMLVRRLNLLIFRLINSKKKKQKS